MIWTLGLGSAQGPTSPGSPFWVEATLGIPSERRSARLSIASRTWSGVSPSLRPNVCNRPSAQDPDHAERRALPSLIYRAVVIDRAAWDDIRIVRWSILPVIALALALFWPHFTEHNASISVGTRAETDAATADNHCLNTPGPHHFILCRQRIEFTTDLLRQDAPDARASYPVAGLRMVLPRRIGQGRGARRPCDLRVIRLGLHVRESDGVGDSPSFDVACWCLT